MTKEWICRICKKSFEFMHERDMHTKKHPKFWDQLIKSEKENDNRLSIIIDLKEYKKMYCNKKDT